MFLYSKKVTDKAYCLQTRLGPSKLSQSITSSPPSPPLRPSSSPQIPTQSTSRPIKPRPNSSSTRAPAPTPEVPFTPDITDMPVADVPNGVVESVSPEVEAAEQIGDEDFVSPYRGRLPRMPLFGGRRMY